MEQRPILPKPPVDAPATAAGSGQGATPMLRLLSRAAQAEGGWLPFDRFMALALYAPGLGYYAGHRPKFGLLPPTPQAPQGSDFVTAPELSPLFGIALAAQVADALVASGTDEVWEFGAGSGALARQLLAGLAGQGVFLRRYVIVELSASLRERQRAALKDLLEAGAVQVEWVDQLPERLEGVVVGNEVLDAMPVKLLARQGGIWHERGVRVLANADGAIALSWEDRVTDTRPPVDPAGPHDYLTEIQPQAEAFIRTLADRLVRGVALFIDYGFPEDEFFHPQRSQGTLMCHHHHRADDDPLVLVGDKDITAHVNFTGIALAAQDAGLDVVGYTSQARFLINCGIAAWLDTAELPQRTMAKRLIHEHEMGELFKVVALARGTAVDWVPMGFAQGDRTHRL